MIVESFSDRSIPSQYTRLFEQEGNDFFSTKIWVENFLKTVVDEDDAVWWIGCKTTSETPIFVLPLWQQRKPRWWHPKRISSLSNYYTTLFQPIHNITNQHQLKQAIELAAKKTCQLEWDILHIYSLDPKSSLFTLLKEAFVNQRTYVEPYFQYGNWYLTPTESEKECTYSARPNTIKKQLQKLKNVDWDIKIYTDWNEVENALIDFNKLYQARWNRLEPHKRFIPNISKLTAEKGWLKIGVLYIRNEAAAAQIWFHCNNTAYIFKIAQDPRFSSYSPGTILTGYLIENAINIGKANKVDFLSGDDSYKKEWMSHRGERWGLEIIKKFTPFGMLYYLKSNIKRKFNFPS